MDSLEKRIQTFHFLGSYLNAMVKNNFQDFTWKAEGIVLKVDFQNDHKALLEYLSRSEKHNPWFTSLNVKQAITQWAQLLNKSVLKKWLSNYKFKRETKTIGVIMAGNIPMVGFHDYLSVLICGHKLQAKLSSADYYLIPLLNNILKQLNTELGQKTEFFNDSLGKIDALIATGSDNTSRYFKYYYNHVPSIIRKNKNGVAVLNGKETEQDLIHLCKDIFSYFGMGCRSVSKIFIPKDYDFSLLISAIGNFRYVIKHRKYFNNYLYQKTIYKLNNFHHIDTGILLLKENNAFASPLGVVFYEKYEDEKTLMRKLVFEREKIQCIAGKPYLSFGSSQSPALDDYADGVDTIGFLSKL